MSILQILRNNCGRWVSKYDDTLRVATSSLPSGTVSEFYSQRLTGGGGFSPYTWSIVSGNLPPGLSFDSLSGVISGTPSASGTFTFTVQVLGSNGSAATSTLNLSVIEIRTPTLQPVMINAACQITLAVNGGTAPYTWAIRSGSLPGGLTIHPATAVISGSPLKSGLYTFTVQVMDSLYAVAIKQYTLQVYDPLIITTSSLPDGMAGRSYNKTLTASGGQPGYIWTVSDGSLPDGLSLSSSGVISGTPNMTASFDFTVYVTDTGGRTASTVSSITIHENLAITTSSLPSGTVGTPYIQTTIEATGGETPYTWSGDLPDGLTINSTTGEITGIPKAPGVSSLTVHVGDANSFTVTKKFTVTISPLSCQNSPARIERTEVQYGSVHNAYDASINNDIIQTQALSHSEEIVFDQDLSITLKGGYDCDYTGNPWRTAVIGTITISDGCVVIEHIVLQ